VVLVRKEEEEDTASGRQRKEKHKE